MTGLPRWCQFGIAFALACAGACGDGNPGNPNADAGRADAAFEIIDAAPPADRIDPLLWVDFSAGGCDSGGFDDQPCIGVAPLSLRFTATAPAQVDTYVWAFGDGSPSEDIASPVHVFNAPGTYDINLVVGGPGGTASSTRAGFVVVAGGSVGAACGADVNCTSGLTCVCDDGEACPAGLATGLCTKSCSEALPCDEPAVCADLAAGAPAEPQVWQRALCLAGCDDDSGCREGHACRDVRDADGTTWVRGCFPPEVLSDEGASCTGPDSDRVDAVCTGGACVDEGVRGLCAATCTPGAAATCPTYATCATFADAALGSRCVARCSKTVACDGDPWLACEPPGGDGDQGFTVLETPASEGYCTPKTCETAEECGPDGTCDGGFCAPA